MKKLLLSLCIAQITINVTVRAQQGFDLVIKNVNILDGTGSKAYKGMIAVKEGRIAYVGKAAAYKAKATIDGKNNTAAPGFIDVHTHPEANLFFIPTADNFLRDGVTSIIAGNCGNSQVDLKKFFYSLDSTGISLNVASLIGHNSVRSEIMSDANRLPTAIEQQRMEGLVEQAMKDGAVGFSTGLIYVPGTFSNTEEVIGLAKIASKYGGVYASHIRNEAAFHLEAIREALQIGSQAKIPVQISHFKEGGLANWGKSRFSLALIDSARDAGIDVTIDQYPYIAGSTGLASFMPNFIRAGSYDSLKYRLLQPGLRDSVKQIMVELFRSEKYDSISHYVIARSPDSIYNGKSISHISRMKGRVVNLENDVETLFDLVNLGPTGVVIYAMSEKDVINIMRYPYNMIASDGGIVAKTGNEVPHPRSFGTNARILARYVREQKVISLQEAIQRMTTLPAKRFNIKDRGELKKGMWADIVVFNVKEINDNATYQNPKQYTSGFQYVIVNGIIVVENDHHNGGTPGKIISGIGTRL